MSRLLAATYLKHFCCYAAWKRPRP